MKSMRDYARRLTVALFNIDEIYYTNELTKTMQESELCLMYALDDGLPHSQRQIAEEWLIPKTTLNTLVKHWERDGLLILSSIPGKRREMQISLTDSGKRHVEKWMRVVYQAEEEAVEKTIELYSEAFIEAIEFYVTALRTAFQNQTEEKNHS